MIDRLQEIKLWNESLSFLYKYLPTYVSAVKEGLSITTVNTKVQETSAGVVRIAKYLASHPYISLNKEETLVEIDEKRKLQSAFSFIPYHAFFDKKNKMLYLKSDQTKPILTIPLQTGTGYDDARNLLLADIVENFIVSLLILVGFPIASIDQEKIVEVLLKVKKILLEEKPFSTVLRRRLMKKDGNPETLTLNLVIEVIKDLYKNGHMKDLIYTLTSSESLLKRMETLIKITVVVVSIISHYISTVSVKRLLIGTELLYKVTLLGELWSESQPKSKL